MTATEIRTNPIAKILGLPHIDDGTVFVFVNVTARTRRQELELGFNQVIHTLYYSKKGVGKNSDKLKRVRLPTPAQLIRHLWSLKSEQRYQSTTASCS